MGIWDKLGFGKKDAGEQPKPQEEKPPQQSGDDDFVAGRQRIMGQQLEQILANQQRLNTGPSEKITVDPKLARESIAFARIQEYLQDAVEHAKESLEAKSRELQSFQTNPAAWQEKWQMQVIVPGTQKPPFDAWLSDQRERVIQALTRADEFNTMTQYINAAYEESGKDPVRAMQLLESRAAEIDRHVAQLEQQRVHPDTIVQMRNKSKRLYGAANKLDQLMNP